MAKMGRPKAYTPELAKEVIKRYSNGESITNICKDEHMPAFSTVYLWVEDYPDFSQAFTRAKKIHAHSLAEQSNQIVDDESRDIIETAKGPMPNHAAVQRDRLRLGHRQWLAAKLNREEYGEKQDINITGQLDVRPVINISSSALPAIDVEAVEILPEEPKQIEDQSSERANTLDTEETRRNAREEESDSRRSSDSAPTAERILPGRTDNGD